MALTSPGVEVSVINESFYVPSDAGTTPLFIVASSQDKQNGAGDGTAVGTQTANANTAYLISSQRELTETFGDPKFYTDASGNSINGYELNEYGLQAAYSFLGVANRAFVLRANVNTTELVGSALAPTAAPADGTYWFDLASSSYGLFEWSQTNQTFTATATDTYYTVVSNAGCISDSSNNLYVIVAHTGITTIDGKEINIYPNPVFNELTIEIADNESPITYEIINAEGKTVLKGDLINKTVVNTSVLAKGTYIVKLKNEKIIKFKKLIKN